MNKPVVGILGGMGPQASCELYRLVNSLSSSHYGAAENSDFPHLLLNSLPVPDLIADEERRLETVAFVENGAAALVRAGATDLVMACNTMHAFFTGDNLEAGPKFHSLIDIVADALLAQKAARTFILSTKTTLATRLYQAALEQRGLAYALPTPSLSDLTVEIILKTIAGALQPPEIDGFTDRIVAEAHFDPEIDTILLACTELPLAIRGPLTGYRTVSSLSEAAHYICRLTFPSSAAN